MRKLIFLFPLFLTKSIFTQISLPFEKVYEYHKNKNGECLIIVYDGNIVFEKYDGNGSKDKLHMLASGSKSFVGIAAVCAVEDGIIDLDDKVCDVIEKWKKDPLKSKITYRHLLNLTSGLSGGIGKPFGSATWEDLLEVPAIEIPGKKFIYGNVSLNIFAYTLQLKLKNETFENYLKRKILEPLGIKLEWRIRFKDGNPQVAGGAYMTSRDWAKFGEFIRVGGSINGKKIIDNKLLAECFKGSEIFPAYGLTWWLIGEIDNKNTNIITNLIIKKAGWDKVVKDELIPKDLISASGAGGQRLYIIPSYKLVIVRLGNFSPYKEENFNDFEFLSLLFKP